MVLKLNLKPHEKCIIGGAALQNGNKMAAFTIANQTTILREKHIMVEEKADTLAKQIYFVVQLIYIDGGIDNSKQNHKVFFKLIREFIDLDPKGIGIDIIGEIGQLIKAGELPAVDPATISSLATLLRSTSIVKIIELARASKNGGDPRDVAATSPGTAPTGGVEGGDVD